MPSRTEVIAELSRRWQADDRVAVAHRYVVQGGRVTRMTLLTDIERAVQDFEAGRPPHPPAE